VAEITGGELASRTSSSRPTRRFSRALLKKFFIIGVAVAAVATMTTLILLSRSPGRALKKMAENKSVISEDGTTIAFSKLGHGPALVLVDGAFCYRENGPAPELALLLAQHFTVFAYDRRGRGESGDKAPYGVEREVEDLKAIINEAGGSAFVLGISSGAGLALQAAASDLPIQKLALYEPPYITRDGNPVRLDNAKSRLQEFISSGDRRRKVLHDRCVRRPQSLCVGDAIRDAARVAE
jgi:pimeloyl-ACP methyl ester carboxylesterase